LTKKTTITDAASSGPGFIRFFNPSGPGRITKKQETILETPKKIIEPEPELPSRWQILEREEKLK
jgi:hypothetical protein